MWGAPGSQAQVADLQLDLLKDPGSCLTKQIESSCARLPAKTIADVLADSQRLLQRHISAKAKSDECCVEPEEKLHQAGSLEQFLLNKRKPSTRRACATPPDTDPSAVKFHPAGCSIAQPRRDGQIYRRHLATDRLVLLLTRLH